MKIFRFLFAVFIEIFPTFNDFVNSSDCTGKIISKSIRLQPVFNQKRFQVDKKHFFFLVKKLEISGNCIYDYAHSFFGEDF